MTINFNPNGTITGVAVGGLPDGIVDTDMLHSNVNKGVAKAWIKFRGDTTGAIIASYGITSISNPDTAEYIITFSTAFANANYIVTAIVSGNPAIHRGIGIVDQAQTTTSCRVNIFSTSGGGDHEDTDENCIAFFGDQ